MSELYDSLQSPLWWASVVVAGILVNLTAAYLKPLMDRILGSVSESYRTRSEERRKRGEEIIARLREDRDAQYRLFLVELRLRMQSFDYHLAAAVVILLLSIGTLIASSRGSELPATLKILGSATVALGFLISLSLRVRARRLQHLFDHVRNFTDEWDRW